MSQYINWNSISTFWNNIKSKLLPEDSVMVNYIIDSGTITKTVNNIDYAWHYKKWSNGFCEAWTKKSFSQVSHWSGNWFQVEIPIPDDFFIETPYCVYASAYASGVPSSIVGGCDWTTTLWTGYVYADGQSGNNLNITANLYAVGYWR